MTILNFKYNVTDDESITSYAKYYVGAMSIKADDVIEYSIELYSQPARSYTVENQKRFYIFLTVKTKYGDKYLAALIPIEHYLHPDDPSDAEAYKNKRIEETNIKLQKMEEIKLELIDVINRNNDKNCVINIDVYSPYITTEINYS